MRKLRADGNTGKVSARLAASQCRRQQPSSSCPRRRVRRSGRMEEEQANRDASEYSSVGARKESASVPHNDRRSSSDQFVETELEQSRTGSRRLHRAWRSVTHGRDIGNLACAASSVSAREMSACASANTSSARSCSSGAAAGFSAPREPAERFDGERPFLQRPFAPRPIARASSEARAPAVPRPGDMRRA